MRRQKSRDAIHLFHQSPNKALHPQLPPRFSRSMVHSFFKVLSALHPSRQRQWGELFVRRHSHYEHTCVFDSADSGTRVVFHLPWRPMALGPDWSWRTGVAVYAIHASLARRHNLAGVDYGFDCRLVDALWLVAEFSMRDAVTKNGSVLSIGTKSGAAFLRGLWRGNF